MKSKSLFFALYFFEGAPIGLIWWAIPTIMSIEQVSIEKITAMTAACALPWSLKFLLGPLVDRFLFTVRSYACAISFFQFLMAIGLAMTLFIPFSSDAIVYCLLLVSTFSAMQDVLIDAWAIGAVSEDEKGRVNGAMQAGMLLGRWCFGAGFLLILQFVSYQYSIFTLLALLLVSIIALPLFFHRNNKVINPSESQLSLSSFAFIKEPRFILLILIAFFTGFSFEGFGSILGPFLISHEISRSPVGVIMSATLISMLTGSLLGGILSDKFTPVKIFLRSGYILILLMITMSVVSAYLEFTYTPSAILFTLLIVTIYFLIGAFTASSYAYFMKQAQGKMEATRFTTLMAMTNLCESSAAFLIGVLISKYSYELAIPLVSMLGVIGLLILKQNNLKRSQ